MTEQLSTWDDLRRVADELELKIHLAGMEARDRWQQLQPRLVKLEQQLSHAGERATEAVSHEITAIGQALRKLRDDLQARQN